MNTVKDEMSRRVVYVAEDDDLTQAFASMQALEIQHVPVVREGRVVGILSDRDVLLHAHKRRGEIEVPHTKVRDAMITDVSVCSPTTSIGSAVDLMLDRKIHCLPVINKEGSLVGIITTTDLLKLLRNKKWSIEEPLPFLFQRPSTLLGLAV